MANTKSAEKRIKTSEIARQRNTKIKSEIKTLRKKLLATVEAADAGQSASALKAFHSGLDKAAKRGTIHKNTAIRKKARATAMVRKAAAAE